MTALLDDHPTVAPPRPEAPLGDPAASATLAAIGRSMEAQERRIGRTLTAFTIFAVLALAIAMANLLVLATKLDRRTTTVTVPAAAAGAAGATAPAAAAAPATVVRVGLREFSVITSAARARAGRVTFDVANSGTITHELVVIRTNKPAGSLLKGTRADESGNVGETGDLAPGAHKRLVLNLGAGHYALICNLPGHYAAGQHRDFTVVR